MADVTRTHCAKHAGIRMSECISLSFYSTHEILKGGQCRNPFFRGHGICTVVTGVYTCFFVTDKQTAGSCRAHVNFFIRSSATQKKSAHGPVSLTLKHQWWKNQNLTVQRASRDPHTSWYSGHFSKHPWTDLTIAQMQQRFALVNPVVTIFVRLAPSTVNIFIFNLLSSQHKYAPLHQPKSSGLYPALNQWQKLHIV